MTMTTQPRTTDARETAKTAVADLIYRIHAELDAAPNAKVGTQWWTDRIDALKALMGK